jgi:MSHA biogenesis protein MshI
MEFGINAKGWTVIDDDDGPSLCALSVRTAVRAGERPQVLAAAEVPRADEGAGVQTLRELMRQMDRGLPTLVTLGRSRYRLRVMPEPTVPRRELLSTLRWSLGAEAENPLEEFNLAWLGIPMQEPLPSRPKQGYAVMTPRAWLDERVGAWRQAGVRPRVVDIRETALRNIAGALERPGEAVALISPEASGVAMVFIHEGSLYLDRFVDQPLADWLALDPAQRLQQHERIASQLTRSIDVVSRSQPFMSFKRVLVAPEPEGLGLSEYLAAQLPIHVEKLQLSQVFDMDKVPALAQSSALQARCLVALGAALRSARSAP